MAIKLRSILKTFFETGDKPSEVEFCDTLDSFVHKNDEHVIKIVNGEVHKNDGTTTPLDVGFSDTNLTNIFNSLSA